MKKLSAKFLCVVLSLVVLLCALPVTVYAEETNVIKVESAEELTAACTTINTNGGTYTINLTGDIENGSIDIKKENAVVTVNGNNHTIFNDRTAVYVSDGAKVVLGGDNSTLTLKGSGTPISGTTNDNPGLIHVLPGSECEMNANVTLKNHKGENYLGSGVTVQGGTFIMNGGTIENCGIDGGSVCYGGGVAVFAGGIFTMNGGTITECYATTDHIESAPAYGNCYSGMGGGVFVTEGSAFTMNGGAITKCTATNFGGGVAMTLSDIETKTDPETGEKILDSNGKEIIDLGNPKSKAVINNGAVISENKAKNGAGVFASGLIFSFSNAIKRDLYGTGTPVNPGIYVNGGEISSNKAEEMGGGVLIIGLRNTRKAQIKNAEILNNTAANGAGIMNYSFWTNLNIEDCTISENKATSNGGGVCLSMNKDEGAKTTIKNTIITGNTSGDRGAGVYYDAVSELHISGKNIIQNNTFNGVLNNLNVLSKDKPVYVDGDLTGSQIGLSDPTLWDDGIEDYAADAVSCEYLTSGYKENNDTLIPSDAFTSDHETWVVDFGNKKSTVNKTYKYFAKKYLSDPELTEGAQIKQNGKDYYIEFDADELLGEKLIIDAGTIYGVIYDRFVNNYGTPQNKDMYYNGAVYKDYIDMFHDIKSGYYIGLIYVNQYNVYIQIGTEPSAIQELKRYNISFIQCAGNVQNLNGGKPGKLVMKLSVFDPEYDPYLHDYSSSYTVVEMEYDEPISSDKTEYFANDIGVVSAKVDVDKSTETEISHETVDYDFTNEVRLVRKTTVDYHINNEEIDDKYGNDDIFTDEITAAGTEITIGDNIKKFFTVPEISPSKTDSCPYIFKGWYYDKDNENDNRPVSFETDKYIAGRDIYAHWIKVEDVAKDAGDLNVLPSGQTKYGGFDLSGVQVRGGIIDTNYDEQKMPGGLRFVTSLSMDVVNQINAIKDDNIEYGYVAATNEDWINYHSHYDRKLLYAGENSNGVDTSSDKATDENYFGFANNINCTSKKFNNSAIGIVKEDHRNYKDYLLYTLVITYEGAGDAMRGTKVLARPYIHYTDANGLERVAYSEYRGNSNTIGGCYISYNDMQH